MDPIIGGFLGGAAKKAGEAYMEGQKFECTGCHKTLSKVWTATIEDGCKANPGLMCKSCLDKMTRTRVCPACGGESHYE
jgi:hypothetical protein